MWLVTTQGFYSAVAHRDKPDVLVIRARTRADIEALERQIPGIQPYEKQHADYRWRVEVTRDQWAHAVSQLASEIDYGNFKDAVAERQGRERHDVYSEVWATLLQLQRRDRV